MEQYSNVLINGGAAIDLHANKLPNLLAQSAATSRPQAMHLPYTSPHICDIQNKKIRR
jgi:hypothetical protein